MALFLVALCLQSVACWRRLLLRGISYQLAPGVALYNDHIAKYVGRAAQLEERASPNVEDKGYCTKSALAPGTLSAPQAASWPFLVCHQSLMIIPGPKVRAATISGARSNGKPA
ncbi:hypothetical protein RvY_17062 [Ramazzottius varieornatus]|uniref:Secreted protein n=1 Tax=Ramazzottius varieornatus TaxID=947166 RepID=A0A1D1W1B9_RAMVA|nr:hypothetical protein RvY_17062 [Ramazzottius varieornatus]